MRRFPSGNASPAASARRDPIEVESRPTLQKTDDEIGRADEEVTQGIQGAEGRLARAEARHGALLARRERRRRELERQRSLSLQGVERLATALVLPHPEREDPEVRRLRPNLEIEAVAMEVVMEYERVQGRQVYDVHEQNLGYIVTSCSTFPRLEEPIRDPGRLPWHEVRKVAHYYLTVDALTQPMEVREKQSQYGDRK